jgi:hypothetical protein
MSIQTRISPSALPPLVLVNTADLTFSGSGGGGGGGGGGGSSTSTRIVTDSSGRARLLSNQAQVRLIPASLPLTGMAPALDLTSTLLWAALAAVAPAAVWFWLRRRKAQDD